ncbi:hypothetical protein [Haloarchaeobius salinus]|uniref:hypothetical protein n=1 Tax=Haloarchaeobius salinus TaxID=1198298 RepID=UPI00210C6FDE|nr:hypothetical protein [Haloarchaeobius salinus]
MEEEKTLSNEFATVTMRMVDTRNGRRLEIRSPKLGRSIRLDPLELESLTWQDHSVFSEMLETPFGPEDELNPDELDRPHR